METNWHTMKKTTIDNKAECRLEILSERLLYALKTLNVTQADLARRIGIKPQAIQYLCGSKAKKSSFTYEIADALDISSTWLGCGEGPMRPDENPEAQFIKSQKRIPLIEWKNIKSWTKNGVSNNNMSNHAQEWVLTTSDTGNNGYALRLHDKSMYPRFDQNTIAIINPDRVPKDKEFVVAYLKEIDDAVLRQYELDNNATLLNPINTTMYKIINFTKHDEICGVMVEARWQT